MNENKRDSKLHLPGFVIGKTGGEKVPSASGGMQYELIGAVPVYPPDVYFEDGKQPKRCVELDDGKSIYVRVSRGDKTEWIRIGEPRVKTFKVGGLWTGTLDEMQVDAESTGVGETKIYSTLWVPFPAWSMDTKLQCVWRNKRWEVLPTICKFSGWVTQDVGTGVVPSGVGNGKNGAMPDSLGAGGGTITQVTVIARMLKLGETIPIGKRLGWTWINGINEIDWAEC